MPKIEILYSILNDEVEAGNCILRDANGTIYPNFEDATYVEINTEGALNIYNMIAQYYGFEEIPALGTWEFVDEESWEEVVLV